MTFTSYALQTLKSTLSTSFRRLWTQKWFDVSLQTKMGVIVAVGLTGLLAVFTMLGIAMARQATHQALNERITLARLSANLVDSSLRQIKMVLTLQASKETLLLSEAPPQVYADALQPISRLTRGLFLLDQEGQVIYHAASVGYSVHTFTPQWKSLPAVQDVFSGSPLGVSLLEHENILSARMDQSLSWVVVAVPVVDHSGRPVRALAALVNLSGPDFLSGERMVSLGKSGRIDLVDAHGHVLLSTHADQSPVSQDTSLLVSRFFIASQPGAETCLGCYGSEEQTSDEVIAFAPLTQAPLGVVVRQKALETFAPVRQLTIWNLGLGLASIIGALVLVRMTTNSVIRPVQDLTRATHRIAQGQPQGAEMQSVCELPLQTAVFTPGIRRDEIGLLAESFSSMCSRLKQSMDEIQSWNRELDARVQARTQEAREAQLEAQAVRDDLRAIIDALSDKLVVVDVETDQVLQTNRAAQSHTSSESLIGRRCADVLHNGKNCTPPECECPRSLILQSGESVKVTHVHYDYNTLQDRYVDIVASPMRDSQGRITRIVELARDVTEERRIRESLVRKNQQLAILNKVANTVNQSLDIQQILGRALDEVLRLTDIDVGAVFLQKEVIGQLELVAYRGLSRSTALQASQIGLLDGSCGGVMEKGQIVIVPDLQRYRGRRARALQKENLRTLVHVPLTAKGCTLGSMCIGTCDLREFSPDDQETLSAIGSQIAVAIENARLYAEVQHKEQVRGELFQKAITAQEEERKRIARDLHDDTSQALAALIYAAESCLETDNLSGVHSRLENMRDLAQHTLDGVHKLIFDLRPTMLDHLGLVPALRWLAKNRLESRGVRVAVEAASDLGRMSAEVETAVFRVIQEAIGNIARHAGARNVCIKLGENEKSLTASIEDDGVGFDLTMLPDGGGGQSRDQVRGLGLLGMEERIQLLGGEMEIHAAPGFGTQVQLSVPLHYRSIEYA